MTDTKALYDRLGGQPAIDSVVKKFYVYMLADDRVKGFFANTNMPKQIESQIDFITLVTGGPNNYHGLDMREAHSKFKISKDHFNAAWENLSKS